MELGDDATGPRWRSAHDILAEYEQYETDEWARITGGAPLVRNWPPVWKRNRPNG